MWPLHWSWPTLDPITARGQRVWRLFKHRLWVTDRQKWSVVIAAGDQMCVNVWLVTCLTPKIPSVFSISSCSLQPLSALYLVPFKCKSLCEENLSRICKSPMTLSLYNMGKSTEKWGEDMEADNVLASVSIWLEFVFTFVCWYPSMSFSQAHRHGYLCTIKFFSKSHDSNWHLLSIPLFSCITALFSLCAASLVYLDVLGDSDTLL